MTLQTKKKILQLKQIHINDRNYKRLENQIYNFDGREYIMGTEVIRCK